MNCLFMFKLSQTCKFISKAHGYAFISRYSSKLATAGPKKKTKSKQQRLHKSHEVVKYILDNLRDKQKNEHFILGNLKETIIHTMLTNPAQILGFNVLELKKRIELFTSSGISICDATALSLSIPSCFQINNNNFKRIVSVLQNHKLPVEKIIHKYPFVGALDHRQVERNLNLLSNEFNINTELSTLVLDSPMLLSYILNKHSVKLLKETNFHIENDNTAGLNITQSMKEISVNNMIIERFIESEDPNQKITCDAKEFLATYDISPDTIYLSCPEFFITPKVILDECVRNVSSAPFFFGAEDIEKLLTSYPDVFISFHKEEVLKQSKFIAEVSTKTRAYKLLYSYPELFLNPTKFFQRVNIFEKYGIKQGDIGRLFAQKGGTNCFIDCEDFTDRSINDVLNFYNLNKDITPLQIVVSAPISLSRKSSNIVKARLSFMRYKKRVNIMAAKQKQKRSQVTIQSIIRADLNEFVEKMCNGTINEYEEYCKTNSIKNYRAIYQNSNL